MIRILASRDPEDRPVRLQERGATELSLVDAMARQTPLGQVIGGVLASITFSAIQMIVAIQDNRYRVAALLALAVAAAAWSEWYLNGTVRTFARRVWAVFLPLFTVFSVVGPLLVFHSGRKGAGFAFTLVFGLFMVFRLRRWMCSLWRPVDSAHVEGAAARLDTFLGDRAPDGVSDVAERLAVIETLLGELADRPGCSRCRPSPTWFEWLASRPRRSRGSSGGDDA